MDVLDLVDSKIVKTGAASLLILAGLGVACALFTPAAPDHVVALNHAGDVMAELFGTIFAILVIPGIICIFIKGIRFYLLVVVCVLLMLFFAGAAFNAGYENLNYALSKKQAPQKRQCVILQKGKDGNEYTMKFQYLDDKKEQNIAQTAPIAFFDRVYEGDVCLVYILKGKLGFDYVMDMRVTKRGK